MNPSSTIIKINQIDPFQLNEHLKDSLKEVYWRIQGNHFNELFGEMLNDSIKAIGISWNSPFHPHAKYIDFTPTISDELFHKLLSLSSPHDRIAFSCWETENEKIERIKPFQFQLFRKTYIEKYNVNDLLQKLTQIEVISNYRSLKEIIGRPHLEEELFNLLKQNYKQTHLDNPEKDVDWQTWKEILLDDTPDLELSIVVLHNNHVASYIFLHPVDETHYEIGWVGQKETGDLLPLLKQALIGLHKKGVITVEFEIDTTNYMTWQFAELLDFKTKQSWNSYIIVIR
jgi:hypothetical protein